MARVRPAFPLFAVGVATGIAVTLASLSLLRKTKEKKKNKRSFGSTPHLTYGESRRERLPNYIILVRHGESEGNADSTLYRTKPDNLVNLTARGRQQADDAGRRIEHGIFRHVTEEAIKSGTDDEVRRVHLVVSPFERTLQTAAAMRKWFEHRIVRTNIQPRIREQEFGNLQGDDFKCFRAEQKKVGRFWYRFPTGESGSDVYDRVKTWWYESVNTVNERVGYEQVDALVVVTHGLTMRFVLMQLYSWSPNTFHAVWNAGNCAIYVLRKDLSKPGISPYVLDTDLGDSPKSSIDLRVVVKNKKGDDNDTTTHVLTLEDYLSVPPPRTTRLNTIKKMIVEQHSSTVPNEEDIVSVDTVSFMEGGLNQGRSIKNPEETEYAVDSEVCHSHGMRFSKRENSCRFPNFPWKEPSDLKS